MIATTTPRQASASAGGGPFPRQRRSEWVDRFVGSDPGLNRFRSALQSVVTIGLILLAEDVFVHLTRALLLSTDGGRLPAAAAVEVATANHDYLVIGMLLGAIIGMISSFGVMDPTARGQAITTLMMPIPMVAALALGIELGGHRVVALASLAVLLAVGTYLRRFGPRGFIAGMLLFMGDFFGFFLHGEIAMGDLGWLVAEISVGVLVALAVRFVFFYPRPAKALARMQRSYEARAGKVAAMALELFDDPAHGDAQARRVGRQLVRVNEAALMIDAQLGDPNSVGEGSSSALLHERLFDIELSLTNVARFASFLGRLDLPASQRAEIRLALLDLRAGDAAGARGHAEALLVALREAGSVPAGEDRTAIIIPHRFARSVVTLADSISDWMTLGRPKDGDTASDVHFTPSVMLFGGWLPGSAAVSAVASTESGTRWGDRVRMAPYTRTAIQMGIAVGGAIVLGDVLSGRRFYWAVIAAFITFMGANNAGEQVLKALFRVMGTVVGIAAGSGIVSLVGNHTYWSIAVILIALFFGFYLMRINYAFMVVGITVMVSQLYVQLGEFTHALLVLRLEETAVGAGVAIAVVLLVLPLRTRRVVRIALRAHLRAVGSVVAHAEDHILAGDHEGPGTLRGDARSLDATYQALFAAAGPLRRNLFGNVDHATSRAVRAAEASRNYSRNLVLDVSSVGALDDCTRDDITRGSTLLRDGIETLATAVTGDRGGTYVRCSAILDRAERRLDEQAGGAIDGGQLATRDLSLLDGAMARLAEILGVQVTDLDTSLVGAAPASQG